jgi:hypothetical protein
MEFEWDETKRAINLAKHGLDFADVARLDWDNAAVEPDLRIDYGEERFRAFGRLGGELYSIAFTLRNGVVRILSFRFANRKERRIYGP